MTRDRESHRARDPLAPVLVRLGLRLLTAEERAHVLEPFKQIGPVASKATIAFDGKTRRLLYIEQVRARTNAPDLQRTLTRLQRLVATPAFIPWLLLAREGSAGLLYVHSHARQVPELRRWLERHPLFGRLPETVAPGTDAVQVPAIVDAGSP